MSKKIHGLSKIQLILTITLSVIALLTSLIGLTIYLSEDSHAIDLTNQRVSVVEATQIEIKADVKDVREMVYDLWKDRGLNN